MRGNDATLEAGPVGAPKTVIELRRGDRRVTTFASSLGDAVRALVLAWPQLAPNEQRIRTEALLAYAEKLEAEKGHPSP